MTHNGGRNRPRGETAQRVLDALDRDPDATSSQLAERLGVSPEYVRATLRRNGRTLTRSGVYGRRMPSVPRVLSADELRGSR
jgi:biotin operon repressor